MTISKTNKPFLDTGWLRAVVFFLFFLLLYATFAALGNLFLGKWLLPSNEEIGPATMQKKLWYNVIISGTVSFVSVWIFRRIVDKQSVFSLGFDTDNAKNYVGTGVLAAIAMFGIGTLILSLTGNLTFISWNVNAGYFFNNILLMLVVAFAEELVFRGYLLNNLMQSINRWWALAVVSLLFALIHLGNPGVSILSILEIFVGGLMLGINYIFTRNLWFGIALHFAWNFYQGPVLGYKVSGTNLPSLIEQQVTGPAWFTGGQFGLEGSVLALVLNTVLILILFIVYKNQYPSPKTNSIFS